MTGHTLRAFVKLAIFPSSPCRDGDPRGDDPTARSVRPVRSRPTQRRDRPAAGDSVRAAGVRVGTVSSVDVVNHDEARVTFSVDTNVPVYLSTRFAIRYLNLVGQR